MVDVGAPPQQSDWEDIASAEGASEKNSTNFDLRIPQNMHEKPQKARSFAHRCVSLNTLKKVPPDPKKWVEGEVETFPRDFTNNRWEKKALHIVYTVPTVVTRIYTLELWTSLYLRAQNFEIHLVVKIVIWRPISRVTKSGSPAHGENIRFWWSKI